VYIIIRILQYNIITLRADKCWIRLWLSIKIKPLIVLLNCNLFLDNFTVSLPIQNDEKSVDSYTEARERALLQLIFDMTMKNNSFILDNELIEIIKSHPKNNLILFYNAMAAYGLNNINSWRYLLSYTQSMVTCAICDGPIMWHKTNINQPANIDRFEIFRRCIRQTY